MSKKLHISVIQEQIKALQEIKPKVRRTSLFGDNHHDAIDAQIEVLEDNLSEDEIYDHYDAADNVVQAALVARSWMDGEEIEDGPDLVAGWKTLVRD